MRSTWPRNHAPRLRAIILFTLLRLMVYRSASSRFVGSCAPVGHKVTDDLLTQSVNQPPASTGWVGEGGGARLRGSAAPGAAEADVPGGGVGGRALARRDTVTPAVGVVTQVGATLLHPARSGGRPGRIPSPVARAKDGMNPVRGPLPDVAGHVVKAVSVGRKRVDRRSPGEAVRGGIKGREVGLADG